LTTQTTTKYAAAYNHASTQLIAVKGKLVPCETLKRNSNIAGTAEIKGLSRKEYKMVMSMRKDDHTKDDQAPSSNAQSGGRGKNKPEPADNVAAAASDNKKQLQKETRQSPEQCKRKGYWHL
jgi:hypothetical protein